jgi:hypothetical protein
MRKVAFIRKQENENDIQATIKPSTVVITEET